MRRPATWLFATILFVAAATPVQAQRGAVEFGMDLGVTITEFDDLDGNVIDLGLPEPRIRIAAFWSDQVAVESTLAFSLLDVDSLTSTNTQLGLGVVVHSTPRYQDLRFYTGPVGGLSILHVTETRSQWNVGALLGVKGPVRETFLLRAEVAYIRGFENDDVTGTNNFRGVAGLSFLVF